MPSETLVAVFDTAAQAEDAIRALEDDNVPSSAIKHYAKGDAAPAETTTTTSHSGGIWAWILGEEGPATTTDHSLYDRSLESGGTVVTVIVDSHDVDHVMEILEAHDPVDLHERASQYGLAESTAPAPMASTGMAASGMTGATAAVGTGREEVIPLAEETIEVGKRSVDRGTTRLRRYVVERPVEEQISLRNETVSITRRPGMGASAAVPADAFTEKTIEMTETSEEAVVAKTARVHEEVVVAKRVDDRVETVRDTVRREEVEIDGPAGKVTGAAKV
jgi:uncharacterized protein (TIGR02271 family)